jgi:hypothetical protein
LEYHGQGDGLFVVEKQGRKLAARFQAIAAVRPFRSVDAVSHLAESIDVSANRAVGDVKPICQDGARPVPSRLQQRQ